MNAIERSDALRRYRALEADKRTQETRALYQKYRLEQLYIAREKLFGDKHGIR